MKIPNLDNVISALECDCWTPHLCKNCPYDYQFWDDSGDNGMWWCNQDKVMEDALFYLKLYQYLIEENKKKEK